MAVLQRNARSLLLLRLIGKNQDVQSSQLRALSQFLDPHDDLGAAECLHRPYSVVSGKLSSPFHTLKRDGDLRLTDSREEHSVIRNGPHSACSQAGVLLYLAPVHAGNQTGGTARSTLYAHCML